MKWNRSMLPAGKLPLHFLFLTGFVVGLFAVYFGRGILLNRAGMLDEDTLYRMKYMTVDSSILFCSGTCCAKDVGIFWCLLSWQRLIWDGFSAEESP